MRCRYQSDVSVLFQRVVIQEKKSPIELAKSRDEYEKRKASVFEIKQKPIKSYSLSDILHEKPMGNEEIDQVVFKKILLGQIGKKLQKLLNQVKPKELRKIW